jgi:uncharacterized protein (DUF1697 family)
MPVFVSLVRGINVGGKRKISMETLRSLHISVGLENPRTLLQSGNVAFTAKGLKRQALETKMAGVIAREMNARIDVMVRTPAELRGVFEANPFPREAKDDPRRLVVMFLKHRLDKAAKDRLATLEVGPELIRPGEEEVYLYYPEGIGRSKLTGTLIEKRLGTVGTARNWATVTKLLALATALEADWGRST